MAVVCGLCSNTFETCVVYEFSFWDQFLLCSGGCGHDAYAKSYGSFVPNGRRSTSSTAPTMTSDGLSCTNNLKRTLSRLSSAYNSSTASSEKKKKSVRKTNAGIFIPRDGVFKVRFLTSYLFCQSPSEREGIGHAF